MYRPFSETRASATTHSVLVIFNISLFFRPLVIVYCHSPGECVGLPFSSLKRFPVIPTFGLPELTGWTECPSDLCPLSTHQQHPSGRHYVDGTNTKAMPRSILKFSKTQKTPDITMDDIQMEFSPVYNAESRTEYTIVLEGVEIVVSKFLAYCTGHI